jgi:hypothetical protein
LTHLRIAVEGRPDWPQALVTLSDVLLADPNAGPSAAEEAIRLAERAAQVTQRLNPGVLGSLAAAHAAVGQFDLALSIATEAKRLVKGANDSELIDALQLQIDRYNAALNRSPRR